MKNRRFYAGLTIALGLWLLTSQSGQSFYHPEGGVIGRGLAAIGAVGLQVSPSQCNAKHQDDETDLLYYGYRYYNASTGRWLNRDPAEEEGGKNLYGFVSNDPSDWLDTDGRAPSQGATPAQPKFATRRPKITLYQVVLNFITMAIQWDLKITDAQNKPLPGATVSEKVTVIYRMNVFSWAPSTGSAPTDSTGSLTDNYVITWRLPCYAKGSIEVKQDVLVLGKAALFYTHMDSDGEWHGNLRSVFK